MKTDPKSLLSSYSQLCCKKKCYLTSAKYSVFLIHGSEEKYDCKLDDHESFTQNFENFILNYHYLYEICLNEINTIFSSNFAQTPIVKQWHNMALNFICCKHQIGYRKRIYKISAVVFSNTHCKVDAQAFPQYIFTVLLIHTWCVWSGISPRGWDKLIFCVNSNSLTELEGRYVLY